TSHCCDVHFPFQHDATQPDVIVVGSDTIDFAALSSFEPDPDLESADELELFAYYWDLHIIEIRDRCPDAVLVYILGNHERRIYAYADRQAPAVRNTLFKRFRE